mmetsp:Transcript_83849/g.227321  ORF Transcript_83849/g.227321 Transcript_83849/m.227321 type:complete len:87 (+) Transcript_83849:2-262(+)
MNQIGMALTPHFKSLVKIKTVVEPDSTGCSRCELHAGLGVVLWDRPSMMMHRDNPFETLETADQFVQKMVSTHLPTLMRAAGVSQR